MSETLVEKRRTVDGRRVFVKYVPIVLFGLSVIARIYEPDKANMLLTLAITLFAVFEFAPLSKKPVSRVTMAGIGETSPSTAIISVFLVVATLVALSHALVPSNEEELVKDVLSISLLVVPTVVVIGWTIR